MSLKSDELELCVSCGEGIEPDRDCCPACGSEQKQPEVPDPGTDGSTLEKQTRLVAERSTVGAVVLALFIPPIAYYWVGRTKLAILSLLTMNFFLLGFLIVPIHVYRIVSKAEKRVEKHG